MVSSGSPPTLLCRSHHFALNSQGESLQEGESFIKPLLMDGCVFSLAFPPRGCYVSDEFICAGTLKSWGQRGSIYYSSLARERRNNREETGGSCTSKLSEPIFSISSGHGETTGSRERSWPLEAHVCRKSKEFLNASYAGHVHSSLLPGVILSWGGEPCCNHWTCFGSAPPCLSQV